MENHRYWECEYENLLFLLYNTMPHDEALFQLVYSVFYDDLWEKISSIPGAVIDDKLKIGESLHKTEFRSAAWKIIKDRIERLPHSGLANSALDELSDRFSLNKLQKQVLKFLFLHDRFMNFMIYINDQTEINYLKILEAYCASPLMTVVEELKPESTIFKTGLAGSEFYPQIRINRYNIMVAISKYISYFLDDNQNKPLSSFYLDELPLSELSVNDYDLPSEAITAAKTVLEKNGAGFILFYGEPGTGKTELSKILPSLCGKKSYSLKRKSLDNNMYFTNFISALQLINHEYEVLVIDEADELLNTESSMHGFSAGGNNVQSGMPSKGTLNQLLDGFEGKIIFITNRIKEIPSSVLRRIHMHISFKPITLMQRKKMWEAEFKNNRIFHKTEINTLSLKYQANPSRIKQVAEICRSMDEKGISREAIVNSAHDVLKRGEIVLTGSAAVELRNEEGYDCRFLNISISAENLIKRLNSWWQNFTDKSPGINLLFYGAPGTGKSAFARYLAEER